LAIRPNLAGQCYSEIRHTGTRPSRQSSDDTGLRVPFRCCVDRVRVDLYTDSSLYRPYRRSDCRRSNTSVRCACNSKTTSSTCYPEYRTSQNSCTTGSAACQGRRDESVARRTACAGETSPGHNHTVHNVNVNREIFNVAKIA